MRVFVFTFFFAVLVSLRIVRILGASQTDGPADFTGPLFVSSVASIMGGCVAYWFASVSRKGRRVLASCLQGGCLVVTTRLIR